MRGTAHGWEKHVRIGGRGVAYKSSKVHRRALRAIKEPGGHKRASGAMKEPWGP
jgi:hypothetical protein